MAKRKQESLLLNDPLWYKDAVIYELHVKSFFDSDGDGIGDLKGLTQKLDYLKNLGVTALWLLPFYPSPLKDDGYDIADYRHIHPQYGTLRDFKTLLREAHARGLRIITELVLNHTSDQHEWFRRSRRAKPGSTWRDFYVWSDSPEKYKDARIIFTDFETSNWAWDPGSRSYYWHRFYSHQPDLNYDNPQVVRSVFKVLDYWLDMGVDGLRLDAVPYLFEREGTNCENLPETYAFLEKLRDHVDKHYPNRMLLAEANQWPEDAVAYFGNGNRCHCAFHFPLMPRIFMSSWMEDRFPVVDIFEQTPSIPESCQWALFLRNHDELTLEMVSDEERDFMYRVYAKDPSARINLGIRRRLAPLLMNNRRKIELMNILLFSFPGTPVLYYGDEIGMGDNHYLGDRNGVRTPMQWNGDRNAGFSRANPHKLFLPVIIDPDFHYESVNVENQERNQSSLLWWMRRVIAVRNRFKAFGRGSIEFLSSSNPKILAFVREYQNERILVVVNLSRFSQVVELDLSRFAGKIPEEVVSRNRFPQIKRDPYVLTLGFYDYYWFSLEQESPLDTPMDAGTLPEIAVSGTWDTAFQGRARDQLEREILPRYLARCRWFGGKARSIHQVRIIERITLGSGDASGILLMLDVRYADGPNETYLLPVGFVESSEAERLRSLPAALIAQLRTKSHSGVLCDAVHTERFRQTLLKLVWRRQTVNGETGRLMAYPGERFRGRQLQELPLDRSWVIKADQSNTSLVYDDELFLKLYRRLEEGINPDLEIGRFLTEHAQFENTPPYMGALEYRRQGSEPLILGILQGHVKNEGDAWTHTLESTGRFVERIQARQGALQNPPHAPASLLEMVTQEIPPLLSEVIGGLYLERAALLGQRTGELHLALASATDDPKFTHEPFSLMYQRSLYHSMRTLTRRTFDLLRKSAPALSDEIQGETHVVLGLEKEILNRFSRLFSKKIPAIKTRIHGDYHLGQVLFTGKDFHIIDFEGEPARTISERRLKRSPLRDVAGMIRSFHYPTYVAIFNSPTLSGEQTKQLEAWADLWYKYVSATFLKKYLETVGPAPFLPSDTSALQLMLDSYTLEKAIYEVAYELNNRPEWTVIPLRGIRFLLEA